MEISATVLAGPANFFTPTFHRLRQIPPPTKMRRVSHSARVVAAATSFLRVLASSVLDP